MQYAVGKRGQADRAARRQRLQRGDGQRFGAMGDVIGRRGQREFGFGIVILFVVGESADMDRSQPGQRLEDVVRTDLVAAIGRKRDAVRKEQDFAAHARPRAISGPMRLASGNGRRFHAAIIA